MSERENPWKTLGTKVVYENPWISVREDQVIRPDGSEGIYGVVDTRAATGVIALDNDNNVYLVGQHRYPFNRYSWEIIEGGADIGEDPLTAIKRELREEAGLLAAKWQQLGTPVQLSNCFSSEVGYFFLASELSEAQSSPDGTEVLEIRKLPVSEAIRWAQLGKIEDSMSIIALMRYEACLRDRQLASQLLSDYL